MFPMVTMIIGSLFGNVNQFPVFDYWQAQAMKSPVEQDSTGLLCLFFLQTDPAECRVFLSIAP